MHRLSTNQPALFARLAQSEFSEVTRIMVMVCVRAVEAAGLSDPTVDSVKNCLLCGDTVSRNLKKSISRVAKKLDHKYFTLAEAEQEYSTAFRRARAAAAVEVAMNANTTDAAMDSIYESIFAFEDEEAFLRVITQIVGGSKSPLI